MDLKIVDIITMFVAALLWLIIGFSFQIFVRKKIKSKILKAIIGIVGIYVLYVWTTKVSIIFFFLLIGFIGSLLMDKIKSS